MPEVFVKGRCRKPAFRIQADKLLVESLLGLTPQRIVNSGKNDDRSIVQICQFRSDRSEVCRLTTLNETDDQAACAPGSGRRVGSLGDNFGRRRIE